MMLILIWEGQTICMVSSTFSTPKAQILFVDIDHTGCHHFPYLSNVVCKNDVTQYYMTCGRVLINCQDGISMGKALPKLDSNVTSMYKDYNIGEKHEEILLDFDDAEANSFTQAFGKSIANILQGCSAFLNQVHAGCRPAHAWFLKIDPVRIVCMCMCVFACVCVCVSAPEAINN